ncbi:MAG: DUF362 domain-containing protein [Bryobacterales bacterium]|nr:DUF362 domain-containing protein [Bryobacteraceae bacterium]MDW8353175.1 DUF362 domain-containing protein [Bryobacterales bacterium]
MPRTGKWTRREWLEALAGVSVSSLALQAQVVSKADPSLLAMPGPFRGRVVAVEHPASIVKGAFQAQPIKEMMQKGMVELTGAPDAPSAWRRFFEPGDVVGIKLNPVGMPHVISCAEVVREIIQGLESAGVRRRDIVAYDRYRDQFFQAGFDKWLPEGVRMSYAAPQYDDVQQAIEGYDPDHYMDMALTLPGQDISNATARRSYAARFITREVNKLVNLTTLKDHQSAGVTLALKNLSHGLVNNVFRSHSTPTLNACGAFIPAVVSIPVIRNKTVLHIVDGIKGLYHGGPFSRPQFVWEHKTLYFATDPVALDRVCWKVIDDQRVAAGMKPVAEALPDEFSTFLRRQPEHVEIAGAMGLGEWDEKKIDVRRLRLTA